MSSNPLLPTMSERVDYGNRRNSELIFGTFIDLSTKNVSEIGQILNVK